MLTKRREEQIPKTPENKENKKRSGNLATIFYPISEG
jgi:hypothetical protein